MLHPNDDMIARISERLRESGIRQLDLHTDLLDHICCIFEELGEEVPFEEAWRHATAALAFNGDLHQLQKERFVLLHLQTSRTMTRILFPLGFLTTFLFSTGILFRMTHWPGSAFFIGMGSALLIGLLIMIVVRAIHFYHSHTTAHLVRIISGAVAGLLISVGSIFKIFHFPTADMQVVLGMTLLNVVFLPMFFYQLYHRSVEKESMIE